MVRLIPKDTSFFKMFSAMSDNLIAGARALVDLFADYRDVERKIDEIRRIEREGDELTHAILTKLNQTFITPFDRKTFISWPRSSTMFWTSSMLLAHAS